MQHSLLDNPSDYLSRLKTETAKDNGLKQYLEWTVAQEAPQPLWQSPEVWLSKLCTADYGDILAVVDLRSALSFGEVNYLPLTIQDHEYSFIVASDPGALGPHAPEFVDCPPLTTSSNGIKVHPALISLLVNTGDFAHYVPVPNYVLPIGRLLQVITPLLFFDLDDVDRIGATISRSTSISIDLWIVVRWMIGYRGELRFRRHWGYRRKLVPEYYTYFLAKFNKFLDKITARLSAGLSPLDIRHDPSIKEFRQEFWQSVLQDNKAFRYTKICCRN
jgi:hypothetical protein